MTKRTIRAILVDCGEVIWDDCPHNNSLDNKLFTALEDQGRPVGKGDFFAAKRAAVEANEADLYGGIIDRLTGRDHPAAARALQQMFDWHQGLPFELYAGLNPLRDGCREVLTRLSDRYTLAVAANQPPRAERLLAHYGLLDLFSFVGISDLVGLFKPDREFFRKILGEIECPPAEAIMIGDRYGNDIEPALELGMTAVRFACDNNRWLADGNCVRPHRVVRSWHEVLRVVGETNGRPQTGPGAESAGRRT